MEVLPLPNNWQDIQPDVVYSSTYDLQVSFSQDLRNWHIGKVRQISKICLFAGFMQSDAPYNRFLV